MHFGAYQFDYLANFGSCQFEYLVKYSFWHMPIWLFISICILACANLTI